MPRSIEELREICRDRSEPQRELHRPNCWYGLAHALKSYAGLPDDYQIKGVIPHSVGITDHIWEPDLKAELPAYLCFAPKKAHLLRTKSHRPSFLIGNPIHYAQHELSPTEIDSERKRLGRCLLAMPVHSTHHANVDFDIRRYSDQLEEVGKDYNSIRVCLYWKDINRGLAEQYSERGFEVVSAGHMFDPLFLSRIKSIIELADLVYLDFFGTAFAYSVYLNKPTFYREQADLKLVADGEQRFVEESRKSVGFQAASDSNTREFLAAFSSLPIVVTDQQRSQVELYWGNSLVHSPQGLRELLEVTDWLYSLGPAEFVTSKTLYERMLVELIEKGKYLTALIVAEQALLCDPARKNILYGKAFALSKLERRSEALHALEELLKDVPEHPKAELLYKQIKDAGPTLASS